MLPKIKYQTYTFIKPSDDTEVKFRPFNAMEEKLLLMAREGADNRDIYDTALQIVNNCIVYPENEDVTKWATFDLELLFIKIRSKSIGEEIEILYDKKYEAILNLDKVYVSISPEQKKKKYRTISLDDEVGVTLRWPHFKQLAEFAFYCRAVSEGEIEGDEKKILNKSFEFYSELIESIYVKDSVVPASEYNKEDLINFISSFPVEKYNELQKFLNSVPTVKYIIDIQENGIEKELEVKGFVDFFTL